MHPSRVNLNPYSLLGVGQDATLEDVVEAYRRRKADAIRNGSSMALHIEAAFRILKDPEQRDQVTKKLLDQEFGAEAPETAATARPAKRKRSGILSAQGAILGALLVALGVSLFLALSPKDALCPRCEHFSVSGHERPGGQVEYSCDRSECQFAYTYSSEDPDEVDSAD